MARDRPCQVDARPVEREGKAPACVVIAELAPGLAWQLPGGHFADRCRQQIAIEPAPPDTHPGEVATALRFLDAPWHELGAGPPGQLLELFALRQLTGQYDGGERHPGVEQVFRDRQRGWGTGQHDGAPAGTHAVVTDQPLHSAARQNARKVIVAEDRRLLDAARREDHLAGPHAPERVPGDQRQPVVLEPAVADGARHDAELGRGLNLGQQAREIAARLRRKGQAPAEFGLLVTQDHIGAGRGGFDGGRQPGRPGAHDQDVAMQIGLLERAMRRTEVDGAEPRLAADHRLPELEPGIAGGPDEGPIIEANGKKPGQAVHHRVAIPSPGCR